MLTITSWSLNPELGGGEKKDHENISFTYSHLEFSIYLLWYYCFGGIKHTKQETRNSLNLFKYEGYSKICCENT